MDKKCADVCVNWAHEARCRETHKSEKPPAIPRARHLASLDEDSEDRSETTPEFGKVESSLAPDAESPSGVHSSSSAFPVALPTGWPRSLDLRREFKETHADLLPGMKMSPQETLKELEKAQPSITGKYVMLWEHSAPRTALDMCSFVIVTEELAMLTFVLAWDVAWHGFVEGWLWFCSIFWSGDLLFPITTGFYKNGVARTTSADVSSVFLSCSMLLDVILVACDWISVPLRSDTYVRVMSVVRIKKATRLFRVTGVLQTLRRIEDSLDRFCGAKGCDRLEVVCK